MPAVALPPPVATFTLYVCPGPGAGAAVSVNAAVALVPVLVSVTFTSLTEMFGVPSSSRMVATPWLSASDAFVGPLRLNSTVSFASGAVSPFTSNITTLLVWPGENVSVVAGMVV